MNLTPSVHENNDLASYEVEIANTISSWNSAYEKYELHKKHDKHEVLARYGLDITDSMSSCNSEDLTQLKRSDIEAAEGIIHSDTMSNATKDFSLILGMERTLFAALNNAFILAVGGAGLMHVGTDVDEANQAGVIVLIAAVFMSLLAFSMHVVRIQQLKAEKPLSYSSSYFWTGTVTVAGMVILMLELYFALRRPYLDRSIPVTVKEGL